jgi:nitrate/nitrite-specific signal transduction histidine kinase
MSPYEARCLAAAAIGLEAVHILLADQSMAVGNYHGRVEVLGEDELGALAQSFNQMAGTLEQTEPRRMELIGDVAHELRTRPLQNCHIGFKSLSQCTVILVVVS